VRKSAPAEEPEAAESKSRILAAAERLFAEQGYAATSIGEVSESAGVNRALIYYYFKNKGDLYWAVIREGIDQLSHILTEAAEAGNGERGKLEAFVRAYYKLLLSRQDTVRIAFREITGSGEKLGLPIKEHFGQNLARMQALIREGIAAGEFREIDLELAAYSLMGMINVFVTQRFVTGRTFPAAKIVRHTMALFMNGVAASPI